MRTLYICRHAKSDWADAGLRDHDRPLNARGERDAPFMAARFAQRAEAVDLLVSSTALRAITTARRYAAALGARETAAFDPAGTRPQLVQEPGIYLADVPALMRIIHALPPAVRSAMIFGHNPGFTDLVLHLTGHDVGNMPTAGIARIDLAVDGWQQAARDRGDLAWFDFPKKHR